MIPLFFQPHSALSLMIFPDTLAHLDGHTIITHTYSIFSDLGTTNRQLIRSRESMLHLEKIDDPNYYGFITFEMPDKLFTYTADGHLLLETGEVEQVIEFLSDIRTNPGLWTNLDR
ncbi:hypothetical protein [Mucilaginibacter aquaedulcis]|uniref:hypothetical protein n=1 Tax=Mucilaginibacter aquaedulcis TaxID=1187081 RepID=UPI0025B589D9|nr:hypothetical protein [Mucilaginibacter aquaedulcis]MDN3547834.1 hypothetical protein [Mucilaginibacter aquaedulcis]